MIARYYFGPVSAFATPGAAEHRWISVGSGNAIGWCRWDRGAARRAFEGQTGVVHLGTAAHPSLPAAAVTALAAHGIVAGDNVASAVEKLAAALGGIDVRF